MVMNGFLFLSEMVQTAKVSLNRLFFIHYIFKKYRNFIFLKSSFQKKKKKKRDVLVIILSRVQQD